MWKSRYKNVYKTRNPNFVITSIRNFPNLNDTLERNIEYYHVKLLQKDSKLLDIYSDYWNQNGNNFIPLYFADDIPKLEKLQTLQPLGKGWFWCVCYKMTGNESYIPRTFTWYEERLSYYLTHYYTQQSFYARYLFISAIKYWIYENSPESSEEFKHRRFDMIENKSHSVNTYNFQPKDYICYLRTMKCTNWYEFVFNAFK